MNRSHREEGKSGRDVGLIGERTEKVSGYESPMWNCIDKMLDGEYPTTNLSTIAAGSKHASGHPHKHMYKEGGKVLSEQRHMVEGERDRMRENMHKFAHAKEGAHMHHERKEHMAHGGHPHHSREMEYTEPKGSHTGATSSMKKGGHSKHHRKHFAAGGVGKVRKGQY